MKRIVLAAPFAALALLIPCFAAPANKTDLSGTWEMDVTRSESPHATDSSGAVTLVIKQTANELSIETRRDGQTETIVYKLDGSETEKPAPDNGPYKWRAQWEGGKLVTETHRNINRATVTVREARSLDAKGKEMTVDRTLTVQHGYEMRGAKNYSSAKDVFVKAK